MQNPVLISVNRHSTISVCGKQESVMAKAAKTPKRKSAKKGETPKTRPAPLLEEEPIASDDDAGEFIIARPDGYYWRASDGKQEVGPFETFELAQADRDLADEEAQAPGETVQEAEYEIGISDWIDPDTGEPAEGSVPHLDNE
jgi:hypothetical protein